mmetsp:Transcript_23252/g.44279  ORF Transcript_23252/g.44279 Transcript_23252/m.44279 type:complete len:88 (+) Transcript_23252:299-562(+)
MKRGQRFTLPGLTLNSYSFQYSLSTDAETIHSNGVDRTRHSWFALGKEILHNRDAQFHNEGKEGKVHDLSNEGHLIRTCRHEGLKAT